MFATISYLLLAIPFVFASAIPRAPQGGAGQRPGPGAIAPGGFGPPGFGGQGGVGPSQCTTGKMMCCESLEDSHSPKITKELNLVGVNIDSINALTGWNCSPLGVGLAANSCQAQPACCTGTQLNGVVNLGCAPLAPTL